MKEAYLPCEYDQIKSILEENDLVLDKDIDKTFYIDAEAYKNGEYINEIIGTVSIYKNIIKDIAVRKSYMNLGYFDTLISEVVNYLYQNNVYHIMVYTKVKYANHFKSAGFKEITRTDTSILLEYGTPLIDEVVNKYKEALERKFNINVQNEDIASVVVNANPITNGHMYLIEKAAINHKYVIVFVVEEDLSYLSFKERMSLVYLSCMHLHNVAVVSSTEYVVSCATFPGYFLKDESDKQKEWAKVDSQIFRDYFMKTLNIKKRYVGSENKGYMQMYNQTLSEVINNENTKLEIVERYEEISASKIRNLIEEGKIDDALKDIPNSAKALFLGIIQNKNKS